MTAMEVDAEVDEQTSQQPMDLTVEDAYSVLTLMQSPMVKGEYWFLLDKKWFETFKSYIESKDETYNPGPIDNSCLFKETGELKERLQEDLDYVFIPSRGMDILVSVFGITDDNHIVRRKVIEQGHLTHYCVCEVYPIELKLCLYGSKNDNITKSFSRVTPLKDLIIEMKRLFQVDPSKETQVYMGNSCLNPYSDSSTSNHVAASTSTFIPPPPLMSPSTTTSGVHSPIPPPLSKQASSSNNNENQTLVDLGIHSNSIVTLEVINPDGTWPSSRPKHGSVGTRSAKSIPGLCGLMNLGNTCFMNSALQCMSNTPALTEFFLSDKYLKEINTENPLGMQGQIAKTYGDLIKAMWSGNHPCLAPRDFKSAVGRFAPQFSGFQQQDCQELMAFLLDGLHEDLNRITVKPYIEINSGIETRPDAVVAAESWSNYKKRNDSVIIDTFHGLLKSTLVCPDCELVSVTFDPFCYLSLPLPVKRERPINLTFFPAVASSEIEGNSDSLAAESNHVMKQPIRVEKLMVPKVGIASDICQAVAKVINENKNLNNGYTVDPERLIVADVYNHRFQKLYSNLDSYAINLDDIHVYETLEDKVPIPVYLREVKGRDNRSLFGQPMIINVEEPITYETVYDSVYSQVSKFFKMPSDDGEEQEDETTESDTDEGIVSSDEMFTLCHVNSYGTVSQDRLDRSKPLKASARMYLSADFKPSVVKRYDSDREESLCKKINLIKSTSGRTSVNLDDCIKQFTTTEKLGSDDPWFCPRCKKHQEATKKFDLWNLPKVLMIHLKRFSYSRFWRDKLDIVVDYPLYGLNMSPFVINHSNKDQEKLYDLCAVANHYGGLGGGHYTAYGKNKDSGLWHYFDDSNVTAVTEESVVTKAGYVLFYLRRDE